MKHPYPAIRCKTLDGRNITLLRDYSVTVTLIKKLKRDYSVTAALPRKMKKETYFIVVFKSFKSDYASVPRFLWRLIPPFGVYAPAALVHDYLYRYKKYDRKTCDNIFKEMLKVLRVKLWRRATMYVAVRSFGWKHYGKYKQ